MTRKTKLSVGLSILAGIGVGVTALLAGKETAKRQPVDPNLSKKDKAIIFVKDYKFTLLSALVTEGCICGAQVLDLQEITMLTGAAGYFASKYKQLDEKVKELYPEEYEEVQHSINEDNAREALETKKEETYDGKYCIYEPITENILYSEKTPEVVALECTNFINKGLLNDQIVSIYDYVDNLTKITGYKNIKLYPWMHRGGWCLDDDCFCYTSSYNPDGFAVNVTAEPSELKEGEDVRVVNSLTMFTMPIDFSDEVMKLYDVY